MPFIKRDSNNQIIGIFRDRQEDSQQELSLTNKEIVAFLQSDNYSEYTSHLLSQSD